MWKSSDFGISDCMTYLPSASVLVQFGHDKGTLHSTIHLWLESNPFRLIIIHTTIFDIWNMEINQF
jgi:hypothetical protein